MRFARAFALVLLSLLIAAGAQAQLVPPTNCDPTVSANAYLQRGVEAYRAQNPQLALDETLCALAAPTPADAPVAYNNAAFFLGLLERRDEALEAYNEAIRLDPDYASALVNRGDLLAGQGDYRAAIADYTVALGLNPGAYIYNVRGVAHYQLRDYAAAAADFGQAIALTPENAVYFRNRGSARFNLQQFAQAADDYAEAMRLDPDWDRPAFDYASALFQAGRYAEAGSAYRAAVTQFGLREEVDERMRAIAVALSAEAVVPDPAAAPIGVENALLVTAIDSWSPGADAGPVAALAIHPEGTSVISGGEDGLVLLWNSAGAEVRDRYALDKGVISAAVSRQGLAAVTLADGTILLIRGGVIPLTAQPAPAAGIAFTPDGSLLVAALTDGRVWLYDALGGRTVGLLAADDLAANDVSRSPIAVSADGARIASIADDNQIVIWETITGARVTTLASERPVMSLAFTPDGGGISAGGFGNVTRFDLASGQAEASAAPNGLILKLMYSPDGALLLSSSDDAGLALIDAEAFTIQGRLSSAAAQYSAAVFTPDGGRIIAGTLATGAQAALTVLAPFDLRVTLDRSALAPIDGDNADDLALLAQAPINDAFRFAWAADGNAIVVPTTNAVTTVALDGTPATVAQQPGMRLDPSGQLYTVSSGRPRIISVYAPADLETPLQTLDLGDIDLSVLHLTPDGLVARVRTTDGTGVERIEVVRFFYDGRSPQALTVLENGSVLSAARADGAVIVSPTVGRQAALQSPALLHFGPAQAAEIGRISAPHPAFDLLGEVIALPLDAISFSGDTLITLNNDTARLWRETAPGAWRAIANLHHDEAPLYGLTLAPSGTLAAASTGNGVVLYRLDAIAGDRLIFVEAGRIAIAGEFARPHIAFHPDGTVLAVVNGGAVQFWGVTS